jgi:hypothetical protein
VRYYKIVISSGQGGDSSAPGGVPNSVSSQAGGAQWCSIVNGEHDPGALQVEFDVQSYGEHIGAIKGFVRVWGIPIKLISQATNLNNCTLSLYGGMSKGLPLANAQVAHQGLLGSGRIYPAFGNWKQTDLTLDMVIEAIQAPVNDSSGGGDASGGGSSTPLGQGGIGHQSFIRPSRRLALASPQASFGGAGAIISAAESLLAQSGIASPALGGAGSSGRPKNLIHNLAPGQPLAEAIRSTLSTAFPGANLKINISPNLKRNYQDAGFYENLEQYSKFIKGVSHMILGDTAVTGYQGIHISTHGNTIKVDDATTKDGSNTIPIQYYDLIGQPTWVGFNQLQVTTVLRADIHQGDYIKLPPSLVTSEKAGAFSMVGGDVAGSNFGGFVTFQGTFRVTGVRHVGNYRNPSGDAWASFFDCVVEDKGEAQSKPPAPGSSAGTSGNADKANPSVTTAPGQGSTPLPPSRPAGLGGTTSSTYGPTYPVGTPIIDSSAGGPPPGPTVPGPVPTPPGGNSSTPSVIELPPFDINGSTAPSAPPTFGPPQNPALVGPH